MDTIEKNQNAVNPNSKSDCQEPAIINRPGRNHMSFILIGLTSIVVGVLLTVLVVKPFFFDGSKSGSNNAAIVLPVEFEKNNFITEDIRINPLGSDGNDLFTLSIGFEFSKAFETKQFAAHEMILRDRIIDILSTYSSNQLLDKNIKEQLKAELKTEASKILNTDQISQIYFSDYYLNSLQ